MHSVYMTHNPCVYNPSLHVCTQCTEPSQYGWGPSERWGCSRKVAFTYTALWNKPGLPASASVLWTMQRGQNSVELAGEPGRGSHGCESKAGQWACLENKAFLVLDP